MKTDSIFNTVLDLRNSGYFYEIALTEMGVIRFRQAERKKTEMYDKNTDTPWGAQFIIGGPLGRGLLSATSGARRVGQFSHAIILDCDGETIADGTIGAAPDIRNAVMSVHY